MSASLSAVASAQTSSCNTVAACVLWLNTSGAYAFKGQSNKNDGIVGATNQYAPNAAMGKAGVAGYDYGSGAGYNSGVYGFSAVGFGIRGVSRDGYGVSGLSSSIGVSGRGTGALGIGVYGQSEGLGAGVAGYADGVGGTGASGDAQDGYGMQATTRGGVGIAAYSDGGSAGVAVQALAANGYLFEGLGLGASGLPNRTVVSIDTNGNVELAGRLVTTSTPSYLTPSAAGAQVVTFGDRSTTATVNDEGEATLVGGAAYVRLDPAFARTINPRSRYLVFITPEGNSRGLYTTSATAQGFAVRENDGGRSTLAFAYRIVARPMDDVRGLRLPAASVVARRVGTLRATPGIVTDVAKRRAIAATRIR